MANAVKIPGINVSSTIVPFGSLDNIATHEAQYGKGGYRSVQNYSDLNLIPSSRLEDGMLVFVKDTNKFYQYGGIEDGVRVWIEPPFSASSSGGYVVVENYEDLNSISDSQLEVGMLVFVKGTNKFYQYGGIDENNNRIWTEPPFSESSKGLPIFTQQQVDELDKKVPDDYILVKDESDLEGEVTNHEVTTVNGTYLDILFRAIRKLQNEVARLKASFELGINSCTGKETASSRILYDLDDVEEEEPLWAVQESELSFLGGLSMSSEINDEIEKEEGAEIMVYEEDEYVGIRGVVNWRPENIDLDLENLEDPKIFLYTTTSTKNVIYKLKKASSGEIFNISLEGVLRSVSQYTNPTYSTLLIISKAKQDPISGNNYGQNYVWIAVQDLSRDIVLLEGYLDPETLQRYNTRHNLENTYFLEEVSIGTNSLETKLSKFDLYSKYQDFSDGVDAVIPSDLDSIKYKAAHITIRSVDTLSILDSIIRKLQENELVYVTDQNSLYIISGGTRHKIGSGGSSPDSPEEDTMTVQELITNLASQGIITLNGIEYDGDGNITKVDSIELSKISMLSLINESSGQTVDYTIDSEGNLIGNIKTPEGNKFQYKLEKKTPYESFQFDEGPGAAKNLPADPDIPVSNISPSVPSSMGNQGHRGFIARFNGVGGDSKDTYLESDRIKIGAFYSPKDTDKVFGCSHAYIELENTAQKDFYLDGCYIHFAGPIVGINKNNSENIIISQATYHLKLFGKIPAGGTYLIKGKQYASENLPTTFIKVGKPDIEWYVTEDTVDIDITDSIRENYKYDHNYKKLIDLSYLTEGADIVYGIALTYGTPNAKYNSELVSHSLNDDSSWVYVYPYLIDSQNLFMTAAERAMWNAYKKANTIDIIKDNLGNTIYKNTFELDPAKQAFQSYSTKDSSRLRGVTAADYQMIPLNKEYIQFPSSNDTCPVSVFTPKASFEGKNVCTDKTQLDTEKPNMLTVSFGIDHTTTRCFNWISVGDYDEYIWVREKDPEHEQSWKRFQSYWGNKKDGGDGISRKEFDQEIKYNFQGEGANETFSTTTIRGVVYANPKYKNIFPGNKIPYKSHKCILTIPTATDNKVTYEYLAGRSNSDGTPMEGHVTEIQTFNMYPENWTPVIYQITDQQGFHWIEYQAWAAAAKVVNDKINSDLAQNPNIIPILLNTGDMTQNGTRINEWLDYYRAGYCLFDHLEQVNVVGNNDLGNVDETALGTGDDPGKSNPHFYNICYCYEIPVVSVEEDVSGEEPIRDTFCPIYCGQDAVVRYIPSLYYLDFKNFRLFLGNSEITNTTGIKLFGTGGCNLYTGLMEVTNLDAGTGNTSDLTASYVSPQKVNILIDSKEFSANHYIYEILFAWMKEMKSHEGMRGIFVCHEMPFTVVTRKNLLTGSRYSDRSISVDGSSTGLVGSHCNRIYFDKSGKNLNVNMKIRSKGTYWLSRLLENFEIKYCLGGHKHTYACTWPVREYYYYKDWNELNSEDPEYNNYGSNVVETKTALPPIEETDIGTIYKVGTGSSFKVFKASYVSSLNNGPKIMEKTLENDNISFFEYNNSALFLNPGDEDNLGRNNISDLSVYKNLTKYPIVPSHNFNGDNIKGNYDSNSEPETASSAPINCVTKEVGTEKRNYVIYFMLQATGFKLKSNKELPGPLQKFSQIIPKTDIDSSGDEKPNKSQIYPMFAKIELVKTDYDSGELKIRLMAISNIVPNDKTKVFNIQTANSGNSPEILFFNNSTIPYKTSGSEWEKCEGNNELILELRLKEETGGE